MIGKDAASLSKCDFEGGHKPVRASNAKLAIVLGLAIAVNMFFVGCSATTLLSDLQKANSSSNGPGQTVAASWAQTVTTGPNVSYFSGVTSDSSGNTYAVGVIDGTATFSFGNGVTSTGTYAGGTNIAILKYNSSGVAQWAQTVTTGPNASDFSGVTSDSSGNTYAVGEIYGTAAFNFGNSITATGTYSINNSVIVKYNSSGVAQWAQTVTLGPSLSYFSGVTSDSSGNAYAVGWIYGTGTYGFATGVTAKGTYSTNNSVIVKYNASGVAQWAQTVSSGSNVSYFTGVTSDSSSNTYAVGYIVGTGIYGFGNGVTATGTYSNYNTVIVKYNSSGVAQWAQTVSSGSNVSYFTGVTSDSSGNTYAVGYIGGTGTYNFGNNVTATGTNSGVNIIIVKYNSSGAAQWAQSVTSGSNRSYFSGVTGDSTGNTYAVGYIYGTATFGFGNGVTSTGAYAGGSNIVIVKYNSAGTAQWAQTVTSGSNVSYFTGVTSDTSGDADAVGYIYGTGTYGFGNGVTSTGTNSTNNIVIVKYHP